LIIGTTISHYEILEKLGEGGMGVVYRAHDTELDRDVALKFLPHHITANESEQARFLQEARAAALLNHQNICTVYAIEKCESDQFFAMEYVEGKTLREIVPVKKMQDAITYAIQIAEALQEAHTHGIVHRDIKADNIMVNTKNQVKVMDFGLAKLKGSLKLTKTSSTIGTLAYMAPEQIEGGEVDARSDIFSFGIVLYEMLTGHLPFRGEHEAAMVYSIVNDEPEPLQHYVPDAPSELLHILDRALEKDREDRYQAVHEMLIDLRRLKKDSSKVSRQTHYETPAPGAGVPGPMAERRKGWSKRLWVGIAGLALLCTIAAIYFLLRTPALRLNPNRTSVTLRVPFKEVGYPSLSRDGNWVVFPGRDEHGKWDVYWMNVATGRATRVTAESAIKIGGCDISPDLSQITYECVHESDTAVTVKISASQGGLGQMLDIGTVPKWRPDGQRIGYMQTGEGGATPSLSGRFEIWSIRPDGTDKRLEIIDSVAGTGKQPSFAFCWSPDGESIAWVRNYREGYSEVLVRELATGKEHQLTFDKKTVDEPQWTIDEEILFISTKSGQSSLWMISARGGEATQVTQGAVPVLGARISADNRILVYMQQENVAHMWVASIDGNNSRQITTADVRVTNARFSPNGEYIAYALADVDEFNKEVHLYIMDRDGKNQRPLSLGSQVVMGTSWSPDGKWLAYSSRGSAEPEDSARVYIIQPLNPGTPRLLCSGWVRGFDNENVVVFDQMKTLRWGIKAVAATQVYQDSTLAYPIEGYAQLYYRDLRKGREGRWVVSVDAMGRQKGTPRRIPPPADIPYVLLSRNRNFLIYINKVREICRVWTTSGREEWIGKALPGEVEMQDVSWDGKEVLWTKSEMRSKLVLVKNVFE
jgi:eukaryotic-like serine/threonine-protein kinase